MTVCNDAYLTIGLGSSCEHGRDSEGFQCGLLLLNESVPSEQHPFSIESLQISTVCIVHHLCQRLVRRAHMDKLSSIEHQPHALITLRQSM